MLRMVFAVVAHMVDYQPDWFENIPHEFHANQVPKFALHFRHLWNLFSTFPWMFHAAKSLIYSDLDGMHPKHAWCAGNDPDWQYRWTYIRWHAQRQPLVDLLHAVFRPVAMPLGHIEMQLSLPVPSRDYPLLPIFYSSLNCVGVKKDEKFNVFSLNEENSTSLE